MPRYVRCGDSGVRARANPSFGTALMRLYRRLLRFLRPHRWRLAGNIVLNVTAAALDGIAFTLLIPLLALSVVVSFFGRSKRRQPEPAISAPG